MPFSGASRRFCSIRFRQARVPNAPQRPSAVPRMTAARPELASLPCATREHDPRPFPAAAAVPPASGTTSPASWRRSSPPWMRSRASVNACAPTPLRPPSAGCRCLRRRGRRLGARQGGAEAARAEAGEAAASSRARRSSPREAEAEAERVRDAGELRLAELVDAVVTCVRAAAR